MVLTVGVFDAAIARARSYAESNMTAEVVITRPGEPTLDGITGNLSATTVTGVYIGKARVYSVSGPILYGLGDDSQEFQSTYVSIPIEAAEGIPTPIVDDLVEVTAHADPLMVGRFFRVRDVEAGGQLPAVRRLQVVGVERSTAWEDLDAPEIPPEWLG